ncbi:MAG TPA: hypothetical protein VGS08_00005 [Candidatus Saccharimonadales bacterium]|nr:hypothetical protein [Candidatus Saccharimonadales bacterium]
MPGEGEDRGIIHQQLERANTLRQLTTVTDETAEQFRLGLWDIAAQVAGTTISPSQQDAISAYTGLIEWQVLGRQGDCLPQGAVLATTREGLCPMLDYRVPWLNRSIDELPTQFKRLGLQSVLDRAWADIDSRKIEIEAVIRDMIHNTAEYQLLRSFDQPQHRPVEVPINRFWHQVRASQLEQEARRQFGLRPDEQIPMHSPAAAKLQRGLYELDEEMMRRPRPRPEQGQQEAILRAQAYFTPWIIEAYTQHLGLPLGSIYYDDERESLYIRAQDGSKDMPAGIVIENAIDKLNETLFVGPEEMRFLGWQLLYEAVGIIMNPQTKTGLREAIDISVDRSIREVAQLLRESIAHADLGVTIFATKLMTLLRQPRAHIVGLDSLIDASEQQYLFSQYHWGGVFHDRSDVLTRTELLRDLHTELGHVEHYRPASCRVPLRLLLFEPDQQQQDLPPFAPHEELVIRLSQALDSEVVPRILGYTLVSRSSPDRRYGFIASPSGDPYQECSVPINNQQRQILIARYMQLGLHPLVQQLTDANNLTVAMLVKMVRGEMEYVLPDRPVTHHLNNWGDFTEVVQDGRLQVQCTGAASFLKKSLQEVFGPGCAGVARGNTINGTTSFINRLGHAQVAFSNDGWQYLLDAVPPISIDTRPTHQRLPEEWAFRRIPNASAPRLIRDLTAADYNVELPLKPPKPLDEQVGDLMNSVVEQLKVAFDLRTNEKLYAYLVGLPRHDPARQTLELLMHFKTQPMADEQRRVIVRYLIRCVDADPKDKRRQGIDHYSTTFLEYLRDTAMHFDAIVRQD